MKLTTTHIAAAIALLIVLPACTQVAAQSVTSDTSKPTPTLSLSAAKYEEPVCYAYKNRTYDGVVSLHKEKNGQIFGKTFGVKKAKNKTFLQPFEQSLEGRYVNNHKISVNVQTEFEGRRSKRTDILQLQGQTLQLGKFEMEAGDCKRLINNFLTRDIERRRAAEEAERSIL